MAGTYPSINDRDFDLLKKITNNTAAIADGGSGGGGVTSIAGTANQIVASASTGAVTLSLATALVKINSITSSTGSTLTLATATAGSGILLNTGVRTLTINESGAISTITTATNVGLTLTATGSATLSLYANGSGVFWTGAALYSGDNTQTLGLITNRWSQGFFGTSGISISGGTATSSIALSGSLTTSNLVLTPPSAGKVEIASPYILYSSGNGSYPGAASNGQYFIYPTTGNGMTMYGRGSTYDFSLYNGTGADVLHVDTGTANAEFGGDLHPRTDIAAGATLGTSSKRWNNLFLGGTARFGNGTFGPTIAASGTSPSENLVLTPGTTASVSTGLHQRNLGTTQKITESTDGTYIRYSVLPVATAPTSSNYIFATDGSATFWNTAFTISGDIQPNTNGARSIGASGQRFGTGYFGTDLAANTSGDGLSISNAAAATLGNQRYSPRLRLSGYGWGTTASTSQQVEVTQELRPVQGTVPTSSLVWSSRIGGTGSYSDIMALHDDGTLILGSAPIAVGKTYGLKFSQSGGNPQAQFFPGYVTGARNDTLEIGVNGAPDVYVVSKNAGGIAFSYVSALGAFGIFPADTTGSGTDGVLHFGASANRWKTGFFGSDLAANTSGDGLMLLNNGAATAANQRYSPRLRFSGYGWGTTAGTSQQCEFINEMRPVQGATPQQSLVWSSRLGGTGSFTDVMTLNNLGFLNLWNGSYGGVWVNASSTAGMIGGVNTLNIDSTAGGGTVQIRVSGTTNACLFDASANTTFYGAAYASANGTASAVRFGRNASTGIFFSGGANDEVNVACAGTQMVNFNGGNLVTFNKTVSTPASTTSAAGFRILSGTAPTTPADGDIWFDGTNLKMRVGGVTKTFTLV